MLPVDCQKSPQGQNTPKCHGDVAMSMLIPSVFPCCFLVHSAQHISVTGQTQREHAKSLAAGPREVELSSKAHLWGSTGRDGWSFKGDPEMGMGPKSGDLRQKRWWFNVVSPRKKGVDTPKLIQIMESWWWTMGSTMGFPILRQPRQPHMFTAQ